MTLPITLGFVEYIHDVLVGTFLPFDETVNPKEYRDLDRIASAVARPFCTAFETEPFPSLSEKASALFHALICYHCFINGNKRTAVIALDLFLVLNGQLLVMSSEEVYELARKTATANRDGISGDRILADLAARIEHASVPIQILRDSALEEKLGAETFARLSDHVARVTQLA